MEFRYQQKSSRVVEHPYLYKARCLVSQHETGLGVSALEFKVASNLGRFPALLRLHLAIEIQPCLLALDPRSLESLLDRNENELL